MMLRLLKEAQRIINEEIERMLCAADYPADCGVSPHAKVSTRVIKSFGYFGNCINTVDVDAMWDATQMAGVIYDSDLLPVSLFTEETIYNEDRIFHKRILKRLMQHPERFYAGVNNYQCIAWLYDSEMDIHHFFDIPRNIKHSTRL